MDKRENPYTPGAGLRPPKLAGREEDLERIRLLVERLGTGRHERSLVYHGLRGVGKTVLLLEFDAIAASAGWATSEVVEVGSQPDFRLTFARLATRVVRAISLKHRVRAQAQRALAVIESFRLTAGMPGGPGVELQVTPARGVGDSGDPEEDLSELLVEIGNLAAAAGSGVLFLLDEMQNLDEASLAAICLAFQSLSKKGLPVALVGAGLPDLPLRLFRAKPYADRLFAQRRLGGLSRAEARSALVGPAALLGVDYDEAAVAEVLRASDGYPYFLQEYGRELWNFADEQPITVRDVEAVREIVRDSLERGFFSTRLALATDTEQRYLSAMASLGDAPYATSAVAGAYGVGDQRRVSLQRDGLIRKGLIWSPRRGQVDFTVPLFGLFLRESHPLGSFD